MHFCILACTCKAMHYTTIERELLGSCSTKRHLFQRMGFYLVFMHTTGGQLVASQLRVVSPVA